MPTSAHRGDTPIAPPREAVTRCLSSLWPILLAASTAADGPEPEAAAHHLRVAAELLLAVAGSIR